jgi:hypothetical protein
MIFIKPKNDEVEANPIPPKHRPKRTPEVYSPMSSEQTSKETAGSSDVSHVLFKLGVLLIAASVGVLVNTGQIAQASYSDGMSIGIAHARSESYQQAYDKGVADGMAKAAYEKSLA